MAAKQQPTPSPGGEALREAAAVVEYTWCARTGQPVLRLAGDTSKAYARLWAN